MLRLQMKIRMCVPPFEVVVQSLSINVVWKLQPPTIHPRTSSGCKVHFRHVTLGASHIFTILICPLTKSIIVVCHTLFCSLLIVHFIYIHPVKLLPSRSFNKYGLSWYLHQRIEENANGSFYSLLINRQQNRNKMFCCHKFLSPMMKY